MYIVHVECTLVNDVAGTGRAGQVLPTGHLGEPGYSAIPTRHHTDASEHIKITVSKDIQLSETTMTYAEMGLLLFLCAPRVLNQNY